MTTDYAKSRERFFTQILRELAHEEGLSLELFSRDWIARLAKANTHRYVYGYQFEVNSVTAQMLAFDKAATSALLTDAGLPCAEHELFLRPGEADWVTDRGVWASLHDYAQRHDFDLVAKPNRGTRGQDVFFIRTPRQLEAAAHHLWSLDRAFCLSPRYTIKTEYRLLVLDRKPLLTYAKDIPSLKADGKQNHAELFTAAQLPLPDWLDPEVVPEAGRPIPVLQKSNLSGGAVPRILKKEDAMSEPLRELAQQTVKVLNMRFASVDIIESQDERLRVLEVNSGLVGGSFIRQAPEGYQHAKEVYRQVIRALFD